MTGKGGKSGLQVDANGRSLPVADIDRMVEGDLQSREVPMLKYQCCFCATHIERPDQQGVRLTLVGMGRDPAAQDLFAHITCLDTRFAPTLSVETVFDARVFEPE